MAVMSGTKRQNFIRRLSLAMMREKYPKDYAKIVAKAESLYPYSHRRVRGDAASLEQLMNKKA